MIADMSIMIERLGLRQETYAQLVQRLSELSVRKHYEAYRDVDWTGPDARIDPADPRFVLPPTNPLADSEWYRSLPQATQSRFGLDWACEKLKYGIAFESILSIGLLEFTQGLPNGSPEYRYAMHEVIEESQHSLMFQQFINQSGRQPQGLAAWQMRAGQRIAHYGRSFPELFFFFVLMGEIFIDRDNRDRMRYRDMMHPLLLKIIQIHITEEARHVCFAERYLEEHMPRLSFWRRVRVRFALPKILSEGERLMLQPSEWLIREYSIPRATLLKAFGPDTPYAQTVREIVQPVYELLNTGR